LATAGLAGEQEGLLLILAIMTDKITARLTARKIRATHYLRANNRLCPMKQNITISLDRELIRKARVVAAQRGTSVSRLLAAELARTVEEADNYQQARRQAIATLNKGFHMGGQPLPSRDELHER
jgi:post-segregation antitoxin (ccd killing protein)